MQTFMLALDRIVGRRARLVVAAWVLVLVAALPFTLRQSDHLTGGGFGIPGSQSKSTQDALERDFPQEGRGRLAAVLVPRGGGPAQLRAAVERLERAADRIAHVSLPAAERARALSAAERGRTLVVRLALEVSEYQSSDVAGELRDALGIEAGPRGGVATHLAGQGALWAGLQDLSKRDLESAEATGFPIVLLILLAVFGSLAAAVLPLGLGFVSVAITGALIYALSLTTEMSVFVTNMASMIGIGVAVDYSLFVLARYREEVRAGRAPDEARAGALATSGIAVTFSGLTVIVSLAGLWIIDTNAIRSMALGAILVVAVSVLAAATLLPALIKLLGHRAHARGRLFTISGLVLRSRARRRPGSTRPGAPPPVPFWERWTARVTRRPGAAVIASASALLLLAVPALSLRTGDGALRQFPAGNETRVGIEQAARLGGPGASSPVRVLVTLRDGGAATAANRNTIDVLRARLAADPVVARVGRPLAARDGHSVLLTATPRVDGESEAAKGMVERLREALTEAAAARGAEVRVGGVSAAQVDFKDAVSGSMWKILLFVLALSFIVLTVLLRSVVLPLKAVVVNLLSVGAAYGVLVVVFQWGWLDGLLGWESPGFIDTLTPPLVLAVVFGLSMDYEVFLLTRIRERYEESGDTRRAVAEGLASSARTITSAALIMVAVFAVFVGTGVPSIKQLGLGNAVAIAIDATLVRLVLVPAAMELLGRWNWWLPRPLERLLPNALSERAPARAAG